MSGRTNKAMTADSYRVEYEHEGRSWSAYVPDLPGCIATGKSEAQVKKAIREAIAFHLEGLVQENLPVPVPSGAFASFVRQVPGPARRASVLVLQFDGQQESEGGSVCIQNSHSSATTPHMMASSSTR